MENELYHYGVGADDNPPGRGSGRYPKGSGDNPNQHEVWSLNKYRELKENGLSDTEIAHVFDISTTQLRAKRSIDVNNERSKRISEIQNLKDSGMSTNAIAKQLGMSESTVRNLLTSQLKDRADSTRITADLLKEQVDKKHYIDVGPGVETEMGISRTKLKTALALLQEEGYENINVQVDQLGTNNKTVISVLAEPGSTYKDIVKNHMGDIKSYADYEPIDDIDYEPIRYPKSVDSSRVQIRYAEDGGKEKDGVIELRKGVDDISLGASQYAQVRIGVDDKLYLKGMAMYAADDSEFEKGKDIIFNTNKEKDVPFEKVLKGMKDDPDNRFGAAIKKQLYYTDKDGNKTLSAINIVNEEGDWGEWSKNLASQMLSKQPLGLVKRQLDLSYKDRKEQYDEIMSLTNPAVKKKLLESFAEDCDAASVRLKAAALPRQASHVILPITDMKENQIYAPKYKNGEQVVLIRYPHGGTFEIPTLTVNNRQKTAKAVMENAKDAVGINAKVAERLSGADFDGDTVLVIPINDKVKITTSDPLPGLKDFDPKTQYKLPDSAPKMKAQTKQNEMGRVSNLITDMTIKGATREELERAVKHSMVVIDAEKHHLDYKQSYKDNRIAELKEKYQGKGDGKTGASTLISRAKGEVRVPERKLNYRPDPETGEKVYRETGATYTKYQQNEDGTWKVLKENVPRTTLSTQMAEAKDAYELSSGTPVENAYADYANKMKAMANSARKDSMAVKAIPYSPEANRKYAAEVQYLDAQLTIAKKNAPRERQAQLLANAALKAKVADNPDLKADKDKYNKTKNRELNRAREIVGAKKKPVKLTDKSWEAIQAGAISNNKLLDILNNADMDIVKQYATPRKKEAISSSKVALATSMYRSGFTLEEIGERIGVSASQVSKIIN